MVLVVMLMTMWQLQLLLFSRQDWCFGAAAAYGLKVFVRLQGLLLGCDD